MAMLFVSNVTAPPIARALPFVMEAPVVKVMLAVANKFPKKRVPVPKVAEDPINQKTLQDTRPFIEKTAELLAVVKVLPI